MKNHLVSNPESTPESWPSNPVADESQRFGIPNRIDFHSASIIDTNGQEILITEAMVQNAFDFYIRQWEMAQKTLSRD